MNEFKGYHPFVNFAYFLFTIGFSMVFMHPLCLGISLGCSFAYSVVLKGAKAVKTNIMYMLPVLVIMALVNPAFNHRGVTILGYLPGGNPLTGESVMYGICAAIMIASVVCWFSCFNEVMTSDKYICLFGRFAPSLSLILSMTLRFVPMFSHRLKVVADARKCMGRDPSRGNIFERAGNGLAILSIMTTWSLENAIETADSMRSRGYGQPGRTSFSVFKFDSRDKRTLLVIAILGIYVFWGFLKGKIDFTYFPSVKACEMSFWSVSVFLAYALLCMCPIIIELWEAIRWKRIKSAI